MTWTHKTIISATALALATLFLLPATASARDSLSCSANVAYDGQNLQVHENARSEEHAQRELVEEGCDKICDRYPSKPERKDCEKKCESSATLSNLQCTDRPKKSKDEEIEDAKKMKCSGDVSYNGKSYSVSKKAKSEKKAPKKLIEKACLIPCTNLLGKVDEACMKSCEDGATVQNIVCKPPKK